MYALSLPLQIVMICLIILENIFVEEISIASFASYMLSARDDPYYFCRLTSESFSLQSISLENIIKFCNLTAINGTYNEKIDDISCIQYYSDQTKIIEVVTNIFVWQKLLATVSVYLIRFFRWIFRQYFPYGKIIICEGLCILLLTISVSVGFASVVLLFYLKLGAQLIKLTFTLDLIGAALITLINTLISMYGFAWVIQKHEGYDPCMFHVSATT